MCRDMHPPFLFVRVLLINLFFDMKDALCDKGFTVTYK